MEGKIPVDDYSRSQPAKRIGKEVHRISGSLQESFVLAILPASKSKHQDEPPVVGNLIVPNNGKSGNEGKRP